MTRKALSCDIRQLKCSRNCVTPRSQSIQRSLPNPVSEPQEGSISFRHECVEGEERYSKGEGRGHTDDGYGNALNCGARSAEKPIQWNADHDSRNNDGRD